MLYKKTNKKIRPQNSREKRWMMVGDNLRNLLR